jgi:hypothetical protein
MQNHRLLSIFAALTILNACASSSFMPQKSSLLFAQSQNQLKTPLPGSQIEKSVDINRLEKHVAFLSGKTPLGSLGLIPERGSVQGRSMARTYLKQSLETLGYKVEEHNYRNNGSNILVRLMADSPSDEYIVVGAHLDSVRNAGADDNATGSATVLEAATLLKQLPNRRVNLIFAWFDEEEIGLVGSRYLAKDLRKQGLKITSMHNIDMLGWDGDHDKTIEIAQPDGILWDYYQMVNKTHGLNLPFDRSNTGQTDHESFHREGFDSICISEEYTSGDLTPYYHQRGDVFGTIDFEYLRLGTQLIVAVVGDLALKVPPPIGIKVIPHDRFPSRLREFHSSYDEALHQ